MKLASLNGIGRVKQKILSLKMLWKIWLELTLMQLIRSLKNKIESLVLTIYVIELSMLSFQMTA